MGRDSEAWPAEGDKRASRGTPELDSFRVVGVCGSGQKHRPGRPGSPTALDGEPLQRRTSLPAKGPFELDNTERVHSMRVAPWSGRLLHGFVAGILLAALRAPLGLDWTQTAVVQGTSAAGSSVSRSSSFTTAPSVP